MPVLWRQLKKLRTASRTQRSDLCHKHFARLQGHGVPFPSSSVLRREGAHQDPAKCPGAAVARLGSDPGPPGGAPRLEFWPREALPSVLVALLHLGSQQKADAGQLLAGGGTLRHGRGRQVPFNSPILFHPVPKRVSVNGMCQCLRCDEHFMRLREPALQARPIPRHGLHLPPAPWGFHHSINGIRAGFVRRGRNGIGKSCWRLPRCALGTPTCSARPVGNVGLCKEGKGPGAEGCPPALPRPSKARRIPAGWAHARVLAPG